ncbi:MAG: hypothetical protein CFE28_00585 [Alphaproteobacteria bacterium PA2]|nr:MAG: hypothetical protein CFE28_00585 [Alphaproteobacteria bacterium PA2]
MGLLDGILGSLGGGNGGDAVSAITNLINSQPGGLGGMVSSFEQGGLGEIAKSWVSTGANLPISADQISAVMGSGPVAEFAQKLGIDPQMATGVLAQVLPQVVDHLTPNGQVQSGGVADLIGGLAGLLKR